MRKKLTLIVLSALFFSGCMSLSRAGNTDFHYKAKDVELSVNSGKDYAKVEARMDMTKEGITKFEYKAEGVNATDAIKQTAAVAKSSVGALKSLGEIGIKALNPLP